jgi:tetratricopeptide (TPR) repeat protein
MKYTALIILSILLFKCSEKKEMVVNSTDYEIYLTSTPNQALAKVNEELSFWKNRLVESPNSKTNLLRIAGLYSGRFQLNGKVEDLYRSDSIYNLILASATLGKDNIYRSLAANNITKHEFRQARTNLQEALAIGDGKASSYLMLVDVNLELGDYPGAELILKSFTNKKSFAYLIRDAKIKDHQGDLDSAIILMEHAVDRIKENKSLFTWTMSNLGDMYGHASRISESYQAYLEVLKQDPDYDHALKGIAWIAFVHDRNTQEAKRILNFIDTRKATPDMHLMLAEIAEVENDAGEKKKQLELFTNEARNSKYGGMYNTYLAKLEAEEFSNPQTAISIAEQEIQNRPTPLSYDLLAWGLFHKGEYREALEIANKNVLNRTYEPVALYHMAMIYKSNGLEKEARNYFEQASESSFELGPTISKRIELEIKTL